MNFGNFKVENSPFIGIKQKSEISIFTHIHPDYASKSVINIVDNHNYVYISDIKVNVNSLPWMLYFDGSKSKEGVGAGALLIDPKGNKTCIVKKIRPTIQQPIQFSNTM